jgi:glyoxylate reductase
MPKLFITRAIPDSGIRKLKEKGYDLYINPYDRALSKEELIEALKREPYDAVLCMLNDAIDTEVFDAAGKQCKIFANYAVGFDNIDLKAAHERGIIITNTPGILTNTVAEHTFALMLAITHRIVEADRFMRAGQYEGSAPMLYLGNDLSGKVVGILGLGRIGSRVAHHASKGFDAKIIYYGVKRNEEFEREFNAGYKGKIEDLLKEADYVSIHVPLLDSTRHLINAERLRLMKPTAYLINTSRGAIIDEVALVDALKNRVKKEPLSMCLKTNRRLLQDWLI